MRIVRKGQIRQARQRIDVAGGKYLEGGYRLYYHMGLIQSLDTGKKLKDRGVEMDTDRIVFVRGM